MMEHKLTETRLEVTQNIIPENSNKHEVSCENNLGIVKEEKKQSTIQFSESLEDFDIKKFIKIPKKFLFEEATNFFNAISQTLSDIDSSIQYDEEALRLMCDNGSITSF